MIRFKEQVKVKMEVVAENNHLLSLTDSCTKQ